MTISHPVGDNSHVITGCRIHPVLYSSPVFLLRYKQMRGVVGSQPVWFPNRMSLESDHTDLPHSLKQEDDYAYICVVRFIASCHPFSSAEEISAQILETKL